VPTRYTDGSTRGFVRCQFKLDGHASAPGPRTYFLNGETSTRFNIQHGGGTITSLLGVSTRTDTLGDVRGAGAASDWALGNGAVSGAGPCRWCCAGVKPPARR
jgi:hypothetical protein